ncbi:MAG: NADH-quinone oxidoreductase subunit NuoE [Actinomycetota bacterium]
MSLTETTWAEARELAGRYPQSRSALLPMLHLVQSYEDAVTADGIALCADVLNLTTAEVSAVATFYTMYRRHKSGKHHVGVCTNTLCAVLGGDAIWDAVSKDLGAGHDETTEDGTFTLERIECQAACTHAPVVTFDWEFFDNATVQSVRDAVAKLQKGEAVQSTRGPVVGGRAASERQLAGFDDEHVHAAAIDKEMLAGLMRAKEVGQTLPDSEV